MLIPTSHYQHSNKETCRVSEPCCSLFKWSINYLSENYQYFDNASSPLPSIVLEAEYGVGQCWQGVFTRVLPGIIHTYSTILRAQQHAALSHRADRQDPAPGQQHTLEEKTKTAYRIITRSCPSH